MIIGVTVVGIAYSLLHCRPDLMGLEVKSDINFKTTLRLMREVAI